VQCDVDADAGEGESEVFLDQEQRQRPGGRRAPAAFAEGGGAEGEQGHGEGETVAVMCSMPPVSELVERPEVLSALDRAQQQASPGVKALPAIPEVEIPGGANARVEVYVFVTTGAAQAAVAALDRVLYPGIPAATLLVVAVAYVAARRSLRPVDQIRVRTAAVTATDPRERVAVPKTGDEIARLAATINTTLERLDAASRAQRRFVADAAHELRSPLASLLATLDVAEAYPERADWPETVAVGARQARRLQALADDLLLLARLDAAPGARAAGGRGRARPGRRRAPRARISLR